MLVAILSDLHIKANGKFAYQQVDTLGALEKSIQHINNFHPAINQVIITGDLADFGLVEEYELIRKQLSQLNMPMAIVPGNHDNRQALREVLSTCTSFAHDSYVTFYLEINDWVWIGLDSLVAGKPHGYIDKEQQQWLIGQLEKKPERPHMLCWHHPPMPVGIAHMDIQNLHNAEELAEIVRSHPQVKGIVCGHLHRPIVANWCDKPTWVVPAHNHAVTLDLAPHADPSFMLEAPAIQLFKLVGSNIVSHLSYINDTKGPYPFFDNKGRLID